jgi:hypothetical protein
MWHAERCPCWPPGVEVPREDAACRRALLAVSSPSDGPEDLHLGGYASSMIKARLAATDDRDLEKLEVLFSGDPGVFKDDRGHFLSASEIDAADSSSKEPAEVAQTILTRMTGVAKALTNAFGSITIGGWDGYQANSTVRILALSGSSWDKEHHGLDIEWAQKALNLAAVDPSLRIARVLRLMSTLEYMNSSWYDMYKIYELIKEDAGQEQVQALFGGKAVLRTFTESANRSEISGDRARHAVQGGEPSGRSMNIGAARETARAAVRGWLSGK